MNQSGPFCGGANQLEQLVRNSATPTGSALASSGNAAALAQLSASGSVTNPNSMLFLGLPPSSNNANLARNSAPSSAYTSNQNNQVATSMAALAAANASSPTVSAQFSNLMRSAQLNSMLMNPAAAGGPNSSPSSLASGKRTFEQAFLSQDQASMAKRHNPWSLPQQNGPFANWAANQGSAAAAAFAQAHAAAAQVQAQGLGLSLSSGLPPHLMGYPSLL
jgi:hypothetical protein